MRSEFYEANALMMEEEGAVIAGLLVGLNVIDANLCMKGEDLDSQVGPLPKVSTRNLHGGAERFQSFPNAPEVVGGKRSQILLGRPDLDVLILAFESSHELTIFFLPSLVSTGRRHRFLHVPQRRRPQ